MLYVALQTINVFRWRDAVGIGGVYKKFVKKKIVIFLPFIYRW